MTPGCVSGLPWKQPRLDSQEPYREDKCQHDQARGDCLQQPDSTHAAQTSQSLRSLRELGIVPTDGLWATPSGKPFVLDT
jgi:hypothetical protein